jgi:PAS domain S-box-containing protein
MKLQFLITGLVLNFIAFGQGSVIITNENSNKQFDLSGNLFYFQDNTNQLTFEEATSKDFMSKFQQSESSYFFFEPNESDHWFLINIENQTQKLQDLILSINNPRVNEIVLFSSIDSSFFNTGLLYPFQQRPVLFKNYLFEIKLLPNQTGTICIKISNQSVPLYVPFTLFPAKVYLRNLNIYQLLTGVFYGLVLITLILIGLLWFTEKDKLYFSFLTLIVSLILYHLWRGQIIFQYFIPQMPNLNFLLGKAIYIITSISTVFFISSSFHLDKLKTRLKLIHWIMLGTGAILLLLVIIVENSNLFYISSKIYFILSIIFWVYAIVVCPEKTNKDFRAYIIATFLLLLSVAIDVVFKINIKGVSIFDEYFSKLALLVFFLLILYAFITKFRGSRLEVFQLNKNLEQNVQKRLAQINQQKEELRAQHEELIQQKDTLQSQREELRAQKELLQMKNIELEKLSQVTSKTNNLITIFKPDGDIDWFNASFGKLIGISLDDYLHGEPLNIVQVSSNKNIKHVLNTCLHEKAVVSYESSTKTENGEIRWFQTTLTPILDDRENVKHLIAIDTDITRMKQYESEIEQQRYDSESQKNLAIQRKEELETQQAEIFDSIRYAKRIQTAIMPKVKQIQRDFTDSFVLFLPKDIVSGDFYWYHRIENKYFIAAVDCTGHGVPGAFMSIIGNYLLNSIVIHNGIYDPAEILKHLNRKIKISLKSDGRAQTSDGMDVALAVIDKANRTIDFAGAIRPLYLFSGNQFIELKGDKVPITSNISGTTISSFTKFTYPFNPGDTFYIFSDGVIDQFGGDKGKKFLTKRFKQLLFEINPLLMKDQKEIIKKAFDDWRGSYEQVDDVMVIGIRYTDED